MTIHPTNVLTVLAKGWPEQGGVHVDHTVTGVYVVFEDDQGRELMCCPIEPEQRSISFPAHYRLEQQGHTMSIHVDGEVAGPVMTIE